MNDDHIFRAVLIAFFLVVLPIGGYYRIASQAQLLECDVHVDDRS